MKTLIITVIGMIFIVTLSRSGMVLPHGTNQASAVAPLKSPGGAALAQTNNASADRH